MGLVLRNFHHEVICGLAFAAQSKAATGTSNGSTISEPWRKGRQISFVCVGGAFATNASLEIKVQGLKRSDGTTWEDIADGDGVNDLQITASLLDDGDTGGLENGVLIGSLDLTAMDSTTYKAIRLAVSENGGSGGGAALLGIAYLIYDLYEHPSGTVDQMFDAQRYGP